MIARQASCTVLIKDLVRIMKQKGVPELNFDKKIKRDVLKL